MATDHRLADLPPLVVQLVRCAQLSFIQLQITAPLTDGTVMLELCNWMDENFEKFRCLIAHDDVLAAAAAVLEFDAAHSLFVQIMHACCHGTEIIGASASARATPQPSTVAKFVRTGNRKQIGHKRQKSTAQREDSRSGCSGAA